MNSAVIATLAFLAVSMAYVAFVRFRDPGVKVHLGPYAHSAGSDEPAGFFERLVRPTLIQLPQRFGFLRGLTTPTETERKLLYAGSPRALATEQFFGLRLLCTGLGFVLGLYYFLLATFIGLCGAPIVMILMPIAGFFAPLWWLDRQVKQRQEQITLALPDMLDLLAVCVSAGMSFDGALHNIARRSEGPLSEEITILLNQLAMNEPRAEAFRQLATRNTSKELRAFANALIQGEELGVPIAETLRIQADDMRSRRAQRARELAAKASPRISLVAIFLVAPSAMLLIVAVLILGVLVGEGPVMVTPGLLP